MQWQAILRFGKFTVSPPMTIRVQNWKYLLCVGILTAGTCHYAVADPAPAQGQGAAAAAQALELLNEGKLPDAEDAYNNLISQFPTAGVVPEALFRLGYVQYLLAEYPRSISTLQRITTPPASPEVKGMLDNFFGGQT